MNYNQKKNQSVFVNVIKNWDPFVSGPAFAIERDPWRKLEKLVCFFKK